MSFLKKIFTPNSQGLTGQKPPVRRLDTVPDKVEKPFISVEATQGSTLQHGMKEKVDPAIEKASKITAEVRGKVMRGGFLHTCSPEGVLDIQRTIAAETEAVSRLTPQNLQTVLDSPESLKGLVDEKAMFLKQLIYLQLPLYFAKMKDISIGSQDLKNFHDHIEGIDNMFGKFSLTPQELNRLHRLAESVKFGEWNPRTSKVGYNVLILVCDAMFGNDVPGVFTSPNADKSTLGRLQQLVASAKKLSLNATDFQPFYDILGIDNATPGISAFNKGSGGLKGFEDSLNGF